MQNSTFGLPFVPPLPCCNHHGRVGANHPLSIYPSAREALRQCLPEQLKDATFNNCLKDDASTKRWLLQLQTNLEAPPVQAPGGMPLHAQWFAHTVNLPMPSLCLSGDALGGLVRGRRTITCGFVEQCLLCDMREGRGASVCVCEGGGGEGAVRKKKAGWERETGKGC